jgi:hypothetical protein
VTVTLRESVSSSIQEYEGRSGKLGGIVQDMRYGSRRPLMAPVP